MYPHYRNPMTDQYCIKPEYRARSSAPTFEGDDPGVYWTEWRLAMSKRYQYHVYERAHALYQEFGYRSVLDVGCGPGTKVGMLFDDADADITLIDQPTIVPVAENVVPHAKALAADLETIDVDVPRAFHLIICADVIEHLLNPIPCLHFIRDHLDQDGVAVISTPERDVVRGQDCTESPKAEHVREWNRDEFGRLLEREGFQIISHELLPAVRLRLPERSLANIVGERMLISRWHSCQTGVVQRRST